jgi:hypothetical protein
LRIITPEPIFTLVNTIEFDLETGEGESLDEFSVRIELFQDRADPRSFRARFWRTEIYSIQSAFRQSSITGAPEHAPSDEGLQVEWFGLRRDYSQFESDSPESALEIVLEDIRAGMEQSPSPTAE